ncbi:MAG: alkaline phosphatase D family protein [Verrucomicrobiota bacterium JB023]|nr:alkaline phosphatase D family protein [Verrucomicrobiota bacterium JB023]
MRILIALLLAAQPVLALGFANGLKIGEVTPTSVRIWTRTTEATEASNRVAAYSPDAPNWVVPGQMALTQFTIQEIDGSARHSSELKLTTKEDDYCLQYSFTNLKPATAYQIEARAFVPDTQKEVLATQTVRFTTAPPASAEESVSFTVSTCQEFNLRDDIENGHRIYASMLQVSPDFFIQTGDTLYYDRRNPFAKDIATARYKWNRFYALPNLRTFHNQVPTYWMHDDHDMLKNDCWPGQSYGDLTWDDGVKLWKEQIPQSKLPYRTFRWGKNLQIWLPEGRYYRSRNQMEDGPEKSILGKEQWEWLEKSMKESDAPFKAYVSATPVVGPDRKNKKDNHANEGFAYEGEKLRRLLSTTPGAFVINGDRHWQYHSIDKETGLAEFGCGPASDSHAQGWSQKDQRPEHEFLRVAGGFLSGEATSNQLSITIHDVEGTPVFTKTLYAEED